ncbi:diguanylate cyclase (GGDEF) domain-containing protein [Lachnospiraceae bacterium XBB1006]|nr:diguanylate cyclase (GGDEF) domain-containing protein [Lachnospiraceae bacterium XBB1006]
MAGKKDIRELYKQAYEHVRNNHYEEAVEMLQEIMSRAEKSGEHYLCARALNSLGVSYSGIGNGLMALDCFLRGLEYATEHKVEGAAHYFYNNIGSRYQELGNYDQALSYFALAQLDLETFLTLCEENALNYIVTYMNLADCYRYHGAFERAEYYFAKTREVIEKYRVLEYVFPLELCVMHMHMDQKDESYVSEHLPALIKYAADGKKNLPDYSKCVRQLANMLLEGKQYAYLEELLSAYEQVANDSDSVQMRMLLFELRMEYFKAIEDEERYREACVNHSVWYQRWRQQENEETILAMNIKIQLRKAELDMREVQKKSEIDSLTGVKNRYALNREEKIMMARCKENEKCFAAGILDLDSFKELNATYGHMEGDEALRRVATLLHQVISPYGEVYRLGGDEFITIIEDADERICESIASQLGEALKEMHIANAKAMGDGCLTLSQGFCYGVPKEQQTADHFFAKADRLLYEAKHTGGNTYVIRKYEE